MASLVRSSDCWTYKVLATTLQDAAYTLPVSHCAAFQNEEAGIITLMPSNASRIGRAEGCLPQLQAMPAMASSARREHATGIFHQVKEDSVIPSGELEHGQAMSAW